MKRIVWPPRDNEPALAITIKRKDQGQPMTYGQYRGRLAKSWKRLLKVEFYHDKSGTIQRLEEAAGGYVTLPRKAGDLADWMLSVTSLGIDRDMFPLIPEHQPETAEYMDELSLIGLMDEFIVNA